MARPGYQRSSILASGATTSKSSKMPLKTETDERTITLQERKQSKGLMQRNLLSDLDQVMDAVDGGLDEQLPNEGAHATRVDDYKMQILENNKKILKFSNQVGLSGQGQHKSTKLVGKNSGHQPAKPSLTSNKESSSLLKHNQHAFNTQHRQS
jgi:hypothetical protein